MGSPSKSNGVSRDSLKLIMEEEEVLPGIKERPQRTSVSFSDEVVENRNSTSVAEVTVNFSEPNHSESQL